MFNGVIVSANIIFIFVLKLQLEIHKMMALLVNVKLKFYFNFLQRYIKLILTKNHGDLVIANFKTYLI